jgi:hypothetical protein
VSKLRCNAVLWMPYTGLPRQSPGRPRKYAGRFDRAGIPELPAVDLEDEGKRLHHAQLYYKPFQCLLRVVFVLDMDVDPEANVRPVTLFAIDPEMVPERIYRIYRDRFPIEFNFRDAKQHLGLAACQARIHARWFARPFPFARLAVAALGALRPRPALSATLRLPWIGLPFATL